MNVLTCRTGEKIDRTKKGWYREYLRSDHWQNFRHYYWANPDLEKKCKMCGKAESLELHHKSYDNLGKESPNDIKLLCRGCHKLNHDKDYDSWASKSKAKYYLNVLDAQENGNDIGLIWSDGQILEVCERHGWHKGKVQSEITSRIWQLARKPEYRSMSFKEKRSFVYNTQQRVKQIFKDNKKEVRSRKRHN